MPKNNSDIDLARMVESYEKRQKLIWLKPTEVVPDVNEHLLVKVGKKNFDFVKCRKNKNRAIKSKFVWISSLDDNVYYDSDVECWGYVS